MTETYWTRYNHCFMFGGVAAIVIYILLLLIVPYKSNVLQYFFDRSHEGEIAAIEHHVPENILVNKTIGDMMRNARYDSIGISSIQTESKLELWIIFNQKKIKKTIKIEKTEEWLTALSKQRKSP